MVIMKTYPFSECRFIQNIESVYSKISSWGELKNSAETVGRYGHLYEGGCFYAVFHLDVDK